MSRATSQAERAVIGDALSTLVDRGVRVICVRTRLGYRVRLMRDGLVWTSDHYRSLVLAMDAAAAAAVERRWGWSA